MRNKIVATAVAAVCLASASTYAADATTEKTTVGGTAFIDFTDLDIKHEGAAQTKDAKSGYGVDVTRFYLIVDHTFDDIWSANLTTDFNYDSGAAETQVFIKKAYVQAKVAGDAFVVRVGSTDTPWIPMVDGLYGYRFVEKTLLDRLSLGNTADWGVNANGKVADGIVNYSVSALNGRGYKDTTRSKGMDFEGRVAVMPVKGLTFAAGFYSGYRGQETDVNPAENKVTRYNLLAAYNNSTFRVGGEYFSLKNWSRIQDPTNPSVTPYPEDKADGYSGWASFNFVSNAAVFARYDSVKLSKDLNPVNEDKYFNVGVSYTPRKNIDLALAYKHDKRDLTATTTDKTSEVGFWSQVKF